MGEELQGITSLVFENRPGQIDHHEVFDQWLSFSNDFSPWVKRHRPTGKFRHSRVRITSGRGSVAWRSAFLLGANTLPDLVYSDDIDAIVEGSSRQISHPAAPFSFQTFVVVRPRRGIKSKNNFGAF